MPTSAFVSYSHADGSLVGPIVALLRASSVLVFRDVDSIVPGKRWQRAIDDAIGQSTVLVLFWCRHTRESIEVTKEYETAIAHGKDVLPLLLDDTPLPEALRAFQYIDFQGMGARHHETNAVAARAGAADAGPDKSAAFRPIYVVPVLLAAAVVGSATMWSFRNVAIPPGRSNHPSVPIPDATTPAPFFKSEVPGVASAIVLLLALVLVIVAIVRIRRRRKLQVGRASNAQDAVGRDAGTGPDEKTNFQQHVAEVVGAEVLRRASSAGMCD